MLGESNNRCKRGTTIHKVLATLQVLPDGYLVKLSIEGSAVCLLPQDSDFLSGGLGRYGSEYEAAISPGLLLSDYPVLMPFATSDQAKSSFSPPHMVVRIMH